MASSPPPKKRKKKIDCGVSFIRPHPQVISDYASIEHEETDVMAVTMLQNDRTLAEVKEMKEKNPEHFRQLLIWYQEFIPKPKPIVDSPPKIDDPEKLDAKFADIWKRHGLPLLQAETIAVKGVVEKKKIQSEISHFFSPCSRGQNLMDCDCRSNTSSP